MDKKKLSEQELKDLVAIVELKQEAHDFVGVFSTLNEHQDAFASALQARGVKEILKKSTSDRVLLAFVESVGFGVRPLKESLGRLERLMGYQPGVRVLNATWGLGEIKRLDAFYRRVTVDFKARKGHQLSFDAACETLLPAPENHVLVRAAADPDAVKRMIAEQPADFVKAVLQSFGDMPVTRLEEVCAQHGFVKSANWKEFWEKARADLRKDKCVEIPTRRAEPIHLKASAESYSDSWFTAFAQIRDPKAILSSVKELQGASRMGKLGDAERAKLAERIAFALKGARGVDNALYARIAFCMDELKLDPETVAKARRYLWENKCYLRAARELPARETGALVKFLTDEDRETTKKHLFAVLPEMCFAFLAETLAFFANDADCEEAVAALLKDANPPATLVVCVLGRFDEFKGWAKLPKLSVILGHAIALGEGKQTGETLKMQNVVRRLFADLKWLEGVLGRLSAEERALFFERFQASTAWDPATHHLIVVRMTRLVPDLAAHVVRRETKKEPERITSQRSYAERQAAYEKLVNVDIPNNTKRIEFAKSYGDLSENAEYQYAKDEQRALLQKQTLMQEELKTVKPALFENVVADEVRPGTIVKAATAAGEKTFVVLGEWDNAPEMDVISNRTKLAEALLGKKAGDAFEMTDAEGGVSAATIAAVLPLTDEIKAWIKG